MKFLIPPAKFGNTDLAQLSPKSAFLKLFVAQIDKELLLFGRLR
jgi:hypothetical protein